MLILLACTTESQIYNNPDKVKHFNYGDLDIQYTDEGEGDPLLFIHGLGSSSYTWRHLNRYYKKFKRVICIDLKGFGDSPKPLNSDYLVENQSDMIIDFIKTMNLKNLTIVGNSYGGTVVLSTYINASDRIKKSIKNLVLMDPAAYDQEFPNYIALLRAPIINKLTLTLVPKEIISKLVLKKIFHKDHLITQEMISTYGKYLRGGNSHNALIKTAKNIIAKDIDSFTAKYSEIKIPVLLIWGDKDNVITLDIGKRLNKDILTSTLEVIKNCGHVPQEEHPLKTIEIMDQFFSDMVAIK